MIKVVLITLDESLRDFCRNLNGDKIEVMCVSPVSDEIGDFLFKGMIILFDFELIVNGCNTVAQRFQDGDYVFVPLVRENRLAGALRTLQNKYEDIVVLPCCAEYLQACICKYEKRIFSLNDDSKENEILSSLIGISSEMASFKKKLISVAMNDLSVFIMGETGTGKSYIARLIHKLSPRCNKKFVEENVAAIQETLIEGELFGTKVGAYTGAVSRIGLFEYANNGTLFLDEIACIKNDIQAKLLQVLETGVYRPVGSVEKKTADVRLISATNLSIDLLKNSTIFRNDLYYRICGIQLSIPPLRQRKEDIYLLAKHFLNNATEKTGVTKKLSNDAIKKLESHCWPGNIRELERCIESAFFLSSNNVISGTDISFVF